MKELLFEVVKITKEVIRRFFSEGYSLLKSWRH